ncbi:MAG: glutamate--tRNA ligase family protein [Desulfobacter postgatei]|uniref:glutamate--tRNA ligase family protein n=1 Tax=Desulfobacter postgatei TaxID=2293 RepID=UPI0023F41626|nr:glutamate--tRNA ligase family protein [Desulfobacter postgatei]MDD4273117.1 glutamate--tRNA ligase family protein [Desulfobacter postgatei]
MQEKSIIFENSSPLCVSNVPINPVSRLAPTPSGFLHLGNAVNFLVTWAIVRSRKGRLHLRIDDMDGIRFRPDVLEDIFTTLDWLGLDWDTGPAGPDDFYKNFSLQKKKEYYRGRLQALDKRRLKTFVCRCSRASIKKVSQNGLYPGTCRNAGLAFEPGSNAVRLRVNNDACIQVNNQHIDLVNTFGDFVLWRKDDQPSYHLASLVEDEDGCINFIVRGRDLLFSTAAQIYLARCFGFSSFPACRFIHHGLVLGDNGQKLSKSRGAYALKDLRQSGGSFVGAVKKAARVLGLKHNGLLTAQDLKQAIMINDKDKELKSDG